MRATTNDLEWALSGEIEMRLCPERNVRCVVRNLEGPRRKRHELPLLCS